MDRTTTLQPNKIDEATEVAVIQKIAVDVTATGKISINVAAQDIIFKAATSQETCFATVSPSSLNDRNTAALGSESGDVSTQAFTIDAAAAQGFVVSAAIAPEIADDNVETPLVIEQLSAAAPFKASEIV
ncbi:hypothetical protein ACH5RR_040972 [Cinchona calisaya]|uniref:Uncharacterized protein n=1 Tax=Cinchona calisaya TaxID=153742 RepID=A0ABD2XW84_9GENT